MAKPNLSSAAQFYATQCERNVPAFDKIVIVNNCSEKGGPHANLNPLTFSYNYDTSVAANSTRFTHTAPAVV